MNPAAAPPPAAAETRPVSPAPAPTLGPAPARQAHPLAEDRRVEAPLALVPGARVLWRAARVTQWELPGRAVIVEGADSGDIAALLGSAPVGAGSADDADFDRTDGADANGADGAHADSADRAHADSADRAPRTELSDVRAQLRRAGFLWRPAGAIGAGIGAGARRPRRGSVRGSAWAAQSPAPLRPAPSMPERLLCDLQALAARFGDDAGPVMTARRTRAVRVIGADRVAGMIAALLAAAGIGRVELPGPGAVRLGHAMPGGLSPLDEGRRWGEAAADAIRRAAPDADIGAASAAAAPDLAIAVGSRPMDDQLRDELHADAQAHLCVGVDGAHAVIGPMVLPGWSSCARCLELHRRDRDPAWWALAAQLSTAPRRTPPSDVAVCTIAAGFAVAQALSLLDGESPTTLDATIEMTLPDWRMRRRTRPSHPDCDCMAG